jgi:single-strand DNA-binding protein
MSETYVTLHGWVGGDVVLRSANGFSVLDLRVASTARFKRHGDWVSGDTTWYTVTVWRQLAENISRSVRSGDPVIVHGRLRTERYIRNDGKEASKLVIDASLLGHDLSRGTSQFVRTPYGDRPEHDDARDPDRPDSGRHPEPDVDGNPGWGVPAVDQRVGSIDGPDAA